MIDLKATTVAPLQSACKIFLQDLEALPEEAFDKSFGPKVRTVADIVYEVNLVNDHIGQGLRGEEQFEWPDEGWIKAPENLRTKEAVVASFKASSEKIIATAEGFSAEDMERTVKTEWGDKTFMERFRFISLHLWYHSGQLNFIQTLLGDDEWHWK
ncbi:MAG: DinB family protein [Armatimonadetes bacterium]|nr:DinB family protein [Armatimonadota bacterium]